MEKLNSDFESNMTLEERDNFIERFVDDSISPVIISEDGIEVLKKRGLL